MPLISGFVRLETSSGSVQPTRVEASYKVIDAKDSSPIFQINTGGSATRENPGKMSQTFQLDRKSAEELWHPLGETYNFAR